MAVPDFQSLTLPVLKEFADGSERTTKDVRKLTAGNLRLTPEDVGALLPSGEQTRFANRIAWGSRVFETGGIARIGAPWGLPDHGSWPGGSQVTS